MKKIVYSEPADYFPKDIRKKFGLGEYDPEYLAEQKAAKEKKDREKMNKDLRDYIKKG